MFIQEVYAVKSVRIWYKKLGMAKYISHLDMCRCMERAIHRSKLPFWYTEGFNPHVFLTINMPISLGYTGTRECMDVKLLDDDYDYNCIIEKLNKGLPKDVQIFEVTEPVMKPKDVEFASYEIEIEETGKTFDKIKELLEREEIIVSKRTKKGTKEIDIKSHFSNMEVERVENTVKCKMVLPSSNNGSINPRLFFDVLGNECEEKLFISTCRTDCYNIDMKEFR